MSGRVEAACRARAGRLPIGIVAAIDEELAALTRRLRVVRRTSEDRLRFIEARLGDREVIVVRSGEGGRNAETATRRLLERTPVSLLLGIGFCGALSPEIAPGTVLVGRRIVDGTVSARPAIATPPGPVAASGLPTATFVTIDRMLCTADGKRATWMTMGGGGPAVVDMESHALARVAEIHAVPYVALRAVSDAADESLPLDFNRFVDGTGRVNRLGVVAHAARRPAVLGGLWRLRGRARRCSDALADAVCAVIERGAP